MKEDILMDDYRVNLYSKYISKFKEITSPESESKRKSDYEVYKKYYLPILRDIPKDSKIIDLGCGSGYMLQFLSSMGYKDLYGVDISPEQISKLKQRGISGEVENLFVFFNKHSAKYDVIFALDIVEHFKKEELLWLFSGMFNLLNENGLIIIHTPNGQSPLALNHIYGDLTHQTIFTPTSMIQALSYAGFIDWAFYETGPTKKNLKGIIRSIGWYITKMLINSIFLIESGRSEKILTQDFICTARRKNESTS
jgi:2-polyprenyl-3-methyl-5-hydroxy-6-metoxy-1,4-benzoquinol methylase